MADFDGLLADLISGDEARAETAAAAIAQDPEAALAALRSLSNTSEADQRWWAIRTLSRIDHPSARQVLIDGLADPDPGVRQCAALGLRQNPSPGAIPSLIDALEDSDRLVARLASEALTAVGAYAAEPLSEAMKSPKPGVRIEAARALAMMHDPVAIPALLAALDDPSPIVLYWAETGLENLGVGMTFFMP